MSNKTENFSVPHFSIFKMSTNFFLISICLENVQKPNAFKGYRNESKPLY